MATTSPATPISRTSTVVGQVKLQECFDRYLNASARSTTSASASSRPTPTASGWSAIPTIRRRNPPSVTFTDALTLNVGNHTFNIIHMPGHTAPQTSVHVPEEGVVFTGDNVFHKCRTWLQECDPWEWLAALDRIEALDVETIVPGHGEPCGKAYLKEQAQIVENWVGFIETLCRSRRRAGRNPEGADPGHQAGPLPDRPAPVHA